MNVRRINAGLLNYWVAKSAGLRLMTDMPAPGEAHDPESGLWHPGNYAPSSDWALGGPIVANEWYGIEDILVEWFGPEWARVPAVMESPLKWFMRAYVASQYGDEVEDVYIAEVLAFGETLSPPVAAAQAASGSRLTQWLVHRSR